MLTNQRTLKTIIGMKKSILFVVAVLMAVLFTACETKPVNPEPETLYGNVAKPQWADTSSYDYSSSMTAIIKVDLAARYPALAKDFVLDEKDVLAAFSGDKCIGVAKVTQGIFFLYVTGTDGAVTLRYYSGHYSNLFVVKDAFVYQNDLIVGSYSKPFTPVFELEKP